MNNSFVSLKAVLLLLAVSLFQVSISQAQLSGDSFAEAKTKGSANVTFAYIETPGFVAKEGAKVNGFCVDLMQEFAKWLQKEEGISLSANFNHKNRDNFPQLMEEIKKGNDGVFGLGTFTINEERKNNYAFSPAFMNNITVLMTHKDVPNLSSLKNIANDFKGMNIVTVKGSLHESRLRKLKETYYPEAKIVYVGSFNEVLDELVRSEKVFTELDFSYFLAALNKRIPVTRHPVGDGTADEFGIIMPKNSDWAPLMTRFMKSGFLESTSYRKMISDHLGQHALRMLDSLSPKAK